MKIIVNSQTNNNLGQMHLINGLKKMNQTNEMNEVLVTDGKD